MAAILIIERHQTGDTRHRDGLASPSPRHGGVCNTPGDGDAVTPSQLALRLASRVCRLSPSHRDPHAFHEAKSDIVADLRRLAASIEGTRR